MAQETLNRIKDAELQAKQIVQDAKNSGTEMLETARQEILTYKEELLSKARTDAAQRVKTAEADLEPSLAGAKERAEAVISQMEKSLADKSAAAIRLVIDQII